MENMLVGAGIVFMAGALIGGGLSAFGVTLPLFDSIKRQVLLFLLGAVLLAMGAYPRFSGPVPSKVDTELPTNSELANQISASAAQNETESGTANGSQADEPTNTAGPSIESVMGPLEQGVNRQGYDFNNIGVETANAEDCAELCRINQDCVAMTYVVKFRRCWLKRQVPPPQPNPDSISAVKDQS